MKLLEPHEHLVRNGGRPSRGGLSLAATITAVVGVVVVWTTFAAGTPTAFEAESGTLAGGASVVSATGQSGSGAVKFAVAATPTPTPTPQAGGYPDGTTRPHMTSAAVMAYTDATGTAQTITLKSLPAPGSTFGTNSSGTPNNGAYYDPRGWVTVNVAGTVIDGYNFDGVAMGDISVNNTTITRNWFHNMDGQDSWCIWIHNHGNLSGLTVNDNLCHGTTGVGANVLTGLVKVDGPMQNVTVKRNQTYNAVTFIQFAPIAGPGTQPYGNVVADNYVYNVTDGGPTIGAHVEIINVSDGTGGLLISHNHFTGPTGQTATIYICHDAGDVGNITIDDNLLDGNPQNTIYGGDTGAAQGVLIAAPGNIKITNNKFANTGGQNPGGLVIEPGVGDARLSASGNVYYPSLAAIAGM